MQKIVFGNKEYVRASEVAKRFRYTTDYVGQLCRSKKVDARLVGRNWYVVPESVTAYRKTKHQTQKQTARKTSRSESATHTRKSTVPVQPVTRTKTLRLAQATRQSDQYDHLRVRYAPDKTSTIPVLDGSTTDSLPTSKPAHRTTVLVDKVPAVDLAVASESGKTTQFKSEKLPEISLSGKVSVSTATAEAPANESEPQVADKTNNASEKTKKIKLKSDSKPDNRPPAPSEAETTKATSRAGRHAKQSAGDSGTNANAKKATRQTANFTPSTVKTTSGRTHQQRRSIVPALLLISGGIGLGILLGGTLIATGGQVVVTDDQYENSLQISTANLSLLGTLFE